MKNILLLLFCAYSFSTACEDGLWLSAVDLNKDSTIAKIFAAIDDSLYEKMKQTEWNELTGLCGCAGGGIFVQSRHTDLMEQGWHFNYCSSPDSVVRYEDEANNSKNLIVQKNSVLFNQIQSLKKLIKEKGCRPDSVYEFLENELAPENAKKGIYVLKLPIPFGDIRVPKNVRLLKVYFPDGKLFREIQFSLGLRNGYDKRYLPTGKKYIVNQYKTIVTYAMSGGNKPASDGKYQILSSLLVLPPGVVCTETYLVLSTFKSKTEAENCCSYMKTMFVRFLLLQALSSIHITKGTFQFVPLQDFSHPWTDEMLYKKYGLTEDEIAFIESMIRPME